MDQVTSSSTKITYLTIKNFGKTGATITNVISNPPIKSGKLKFENNPFSKFNSQLIAPNQTYAAGISINKSEAQLETKKFDLTITYTDNNSKIETKTFHLNEASIDDIQRFIPTIMTEDETAKAIYKTSSERMAREL